MEATGDKIIVKAITYKESTIVKTRGSKTDTVSTVISVGELVQNIKAGDTVLTPRYQGTKLRYIDNEYICIRASDVLLSIRE